VASLLERVDILHPPSLLSPSFRTFAQLGLSESLPFPRRLRLPLACSCCCCCHCLVCSVGEGSVTAPAQHGEDDIYGEYVGGLAYHAHEGRGRRGVGGSKAPHTAHERCIVGAYRPAQEDERGGKEAVNTRLHRLNDRLS